jgi:type I site-specific restriction endonuclease
LLKSGVGKRILFLVDRRALAAQAVRAFESFWPTRIESSCQYDLGWQERYDKMSWNC